MLKHRLLQGVFDIPSSHHARNSTQTNRTNRPDKTVHMLATPGRSDKLSTRCLRRSRRYIDARDHSEHAFGRARTAIGTSPWIGIASPSSPNILGACQLCRQLPRTPADKVRSSHLFSPPRRLVASFGKVPILRMPTVLNRDKPSPHQQKIPAL